MERKNETFLACDGAYEESKIAIFGAPFDGTASYRPGARFAPKAVRAESDGIETYSPYQRLDLEDISVYDCGELALPFGSASKALSIIESYTDTLYADGKLPFMIGGEHLVTLGAVRALYNKHPELNIIQFDAHADLRDEYLGDKLSHATVMRRAWELVGDGRIYQFGIRSGERAEFKFAEQHTTMRKFDIAGINETVKRLSETRVPVYVSVDLDVIDPSEFPGTGTPEPGGVGFLDIMSALIELAPLNIVGCDICELSPPYDPSGISTIAACKLVREMLLML